MPRPKTLKNPGTSPKLASNYLFALLLLALLALTLAAYWSLPTHSFCGWDDREYILLNPHVLTGLSVQNLAWACTAFYEANWHPLTWASHMLDVQLFGLAPGWHLAHNLVLHLLNTALLFTFLFLAAGRIWAAFFAAALFALHPLHVESVAWAAERKDLLSGLFFLACLLAWRAWTARGGRTRYLAALGALGLGLMAKPMLVSLPLVLLILDYWPLNRFPAKWADRAAFKRLIVEKIPFFALSALSAGVTLAAQSSGGAVKSLARFPLAGRLANAATSYITYLAKTFWPLDLAVFYPHPAQPRLWAGLGALALLAAVTWLVVGPGRSQRWLAAGWAFFLVTLLPVIGLVQVGAQALADRYTYIPLIGVFIMVAWSLDALGGRLRRARPLVAGACAVCLGALLFLTPAQLAHWRDGVALFSHAIEVTGPNNTALFNLGNALKDQGRVKEAVQAFGRALALEPNDAEAANNLGSALIELKQWDQAEAALKEAVRLRPASPIAWLNLGQVHYQRRDFAAARQAFEQAARLDGGLAPAHYHLAHAAAQMGDFTLAAREFRRALELNPRDQRARDGLTKALEYQRLVGSGRAVFRQGERP